jgi:hypothetical protein
MAKLWCYKLFKDRVKPRNLAQRLAKKLINQLKLDPSEGFEEAKYVKGLLFPGDVTISNLEEAEIEATTEYPRLTIWTDGSKLDSGHLGIGLAWKTTS